MNVAHINDAILEEVAERKLIIKKFKKGSKICSGVISGCMVMSAISSGFGIACCSTGLLMPLGIATQSLTIVCAAVSAGLGVLHTKLNKKRLKHEKILAVALDKLLIIQTKIMTAMEDDKIDVDEFKDIVHEYRTYLTAKNKIQRQYSISRVEDAVDGTGNMNAEVDNNGTILQKDSEAEMIALSSLACASLKI